MTNPLVQISDLLDEVAGVFVSKTFSENYATPIVYLFRELETRAVISGTFSVTDYERSLESIKSSNRETIGAGELVIKDVKGFYWS